MKKWKQTLDERQEREMYSVYKSAYWVLFFGLLAQILIATLLELDGLITNLISFVILLAGAAVLTVGSARRGIWADIFKPSAKTNLLISIGTGVFVFLFWGILNPLIRDGAVVLSSFDTLLGAITAALAFVFVLVISNVLMRITKKRASKLEADYED